LIISISASWYIWRFVYHLQLNI